jgi:polysaccharide export outer membrane protein
MRSKGRLLPFLLFCLLCPLCTSSMGCLTCRPCVKAVGGADVPRELEKMSLPPYVIEPPDILLIDTLRVVPLPPYKIEPLDVLLVQATNTLPNEPISGLFGIEPSGTINLGVSYGAVRVAGMTTDEARAAIEKQLQGVLKGARVLVTLAQSRAMQLVRGEHLVRPDGTVSLGAYGSVYVAGLTLEAAKAEIEGFLTQFLLKPEISVDVYAYNSKFYYIILDGGGYGQTVYRLPVTGNETVLDAISQINGLPAVSSPKKIWVARPTHGLDCGEAEQVLPVDWRAVAQCGSARTNYQLYPGDRVYVQADSLITLDNLLAKILSPIERVFGVTLLGQQTILSFDRSLRSGATGGTGNGGLGF